MTPARDGLTFAELAREMAELVAQKGWYGEHSQRPQTPRNLAVSTAIEAAELLECFQWSDLAPLDRVEDELADVLLYVVQLANVLEIDLEEAVLAKLERNRGREWDRAS